MNRIHLVLDKDNGYALFYTELSAAQIVKAKLEEEGGEVTLTTFYADLTFKQIINAYDRGDNERITDTKLKSVLKPHYSVRIE